MIYRNFSNCKYRYYKKAKETSVIENDIQKFY